jgi:hypothetical protein
VEGVGDDFVRGGQDQTPIKQKRNSRQRIVVNAGTPNVTVTAGNEQFCAPWTDESPGGTVTTSAYKDGKKRCLSAEGGSGDPRKMVFEQNKTFMRAHRKSGGRDLTEEEIRAEAHKRQKKMGDAARAAEMTKEELALEKRKGLAEKEAARRASTGQTGTVKRAAEEAKRKAATGKVGMVKRAAGDAKRWAAQTLFHPFSEYVQHRNWPFSCTSVDELLVLIARAIRPQGTAGRSSALTTRAQATRASTGWRALWTKRLEALLMDLQSNFDGHQPPFCR